MATKKDLAERVVAIESPDADDAQRAFEVATLVDGHSKAGLEARLATAQAKQLEPPTTETGAQTAQDAPGATDTATTAPTPGEPGTAIVAADTAGVNPAGGGMTLPAETEWLQLERMSRFIAGSKLAPKHLQGKPDDVQMILLVARDLGISATRAMQKVAVIEGQVAMTAELMVAVVLRDGHRIWPSPDNDHTKATALGQRREYDGGWGPVMEASFTLDDAVAAGLCTIKDGAAYARSSNGKRLPWELYTPDLLWARAVSRLVRRGFADSGNGVTYVPEELGYIEMDDDRDVPNAHAERLAAEQEATVTLAQQRTEIARRISELPDGDRKALADEWKKRNLPRTQELTPAAVRTALNLLEAAEQRVADRDAAATGDIPDAELVPDPDDAGAVAPDGLPANPEFHDDNEPPPGAPVDPDSVPADATIVEGTEGECAAGDGPETAERPFVFNDGQTWHADCAPFMG